MKRIIFGLMFGLMMIMLAPMALAEGIEHELMDLELNAGEALVVEASFSFQAFALSEIVGVQVRFLRQGQWSDWQYLNAEEEDVSGSELAFIERAEAFALRSETDRNVQVTIMNLRDMEIVASINPIGLDDSTAYFGPQSSGSAEVGIILRREWGADELLRTYNPDDVEESNGEHANACEPIEAAYPGQYRMDDEVVYFDQLGRNLIWPQRYSSRVKKIVIHHTAKAVRDFNEDGRVNSRDYRLAVQAIYTYHTVSRGWGDIGYHYLVDPDGNVYEGRAGGKDVIAAHVLCQNSNTIGIAVMGNYQEDRLPAKTFKGLVNITKYASDLYHINPEGKSAFRGEVLPHIVTHAEVGELTKSHIGRGATACPGRFLKREMRELRQVVANGGIKPNIGFDVVKKDSRMKVNPLQDFTISVTLKNTGEQMWTSLLLIQGRQEIFLDKNLLVSSGREFDVHIPMTASFDAGRKNLDLQAIINGQKVSKKIDLTYHVNRPVYKYQLLAFEGAEHSLLIGEERTLSMTLKNTSNFPWLNAGTDQVQIREVKKRGSRILFVPGGMNLFLSEPVAVGGEVTLLVDIPVQRRVGELDFELLPMIGRDRGLKGTRMLVNVDVEQPKFVAHVDLANRKKRIANGFEETVDIEVKNEGNFDWEESMVWINVQFSRPNGRSSGRAMTNDQKEKFVIQEAVKRGESVIIPVNVRAGYFDRQVMIEGTMGLDHLPSFLSGQRLRRSSASFEISIKTAGRARLRAEKVSQSEQFIANEPGEYEAWVELKNTGSVPWYRDGDERLVLEVQNLADFLHSSWKKRRFAGFLEQEVVMPGELGKFVVTLRVKKKLRRTTFDDFVPVVGDRKVKLRGRIRFGIEGPLKEREEFEEREDREEASLDIGHRSLPPMRVWLTEAIEPEFQVSSQGSFIVWDSKSVQIRELSGGEVFSVSEEEVKDGTVFRMRAKEAPALQFVNWHRVRAFGNNIDDNAFRDVLEFRWDADEGRMIAINELSLEDYMKGIAEVPETDEQAQEKRKVITVLARSYALHYLISGYEKFPGKPYNAADSPAIFQKYNGYNFELRSPKWQSAVEETSGEVVVVRMTNDSMTNDQRVLRAAYFSCTDGERTKSWDEVWPDNEYFQRFGDVFQSVEDPLGDDPSREGSEACGHQVGLSGYGATQMARDGARYEEIIGHYYSGVEIKRIF